MHRISAFSALRWLALLWLAAWLAGCASGPRTVEVPRERLEAALAQRFPFQSRYLDVIDLQVSAPRLALLPESNRLRTAFALTAASRLLRNPVAGDIELSFALRFAPADNSIRLADVRVERLELVGLPEALRGQSQRLGPFLAERMLDGAVLHTFRPEDIARAQGWTPGEIRVTSRGVQVTLLPPVR